ncbi:MAG: hypothetical protein ACRYFL_07410 [Janthinobacterium lividum]
MARATDQKGNTQPEHHDPDHRTYMVNFMPKQSVLNPDSFQRESGFFVKRMFRVNFILLQKKLF